MMIPIVETFPKSIFTRADVERERLLRLSIRGVGRVGDQRRWRPLGANNDLSLDGYRLCARPAAGCQGRWQ